MREEESEIKNKSLLFNSLHERGMIGDEPRLNGSSCSRTFATATACSTCVTSCHPKDQLDSGEVGDFAFYLSSMKLELKLLHEEDLSRFLADLRQQAKALIRINRCHVERLPAGAEERAGGRANLLAECDLDWLTAREAGRKHPPDDGPVRRAVARGDWRAATGKRGAGR